MAGPTEEQRAAYIAGAERLAQAEARIKPQVDALKQEIALLESTEVEPARAALREITDEFGEPTTRCIFCEKLLWDEDDYIAGEEDICVPCNTAAWAELSEEERAARLAEIEAEDA